MRDAVTPQGPTGRDSAAASWASLAAECDAWAAAGRTATLWWRDDDAVAPTPALARLRALASAARVPLALAVIPAGATAALARWVAAGGEVVLQHGFAHANHAPAGARRAELGAHRAPAAMRAELAEGWRRLSGLFGARARPVLVPPWNRVAPAVVALLPGLGFTGLSAFGARAEAERAPAAGPAPPGLVQVNTHVDPVDWRGGRGFAGEAAALAAAVGHLRARRTGEADPGEPTGLLTHHLAHDAATWAFIERFLAVTTAHPAVRWCDPAALFAGAP